jgi:hypothetical protein
MVTLDGAQPGTAGMSVPSPGGPQVCDGWRVRVCDAAGHTRGAGILVEADLVLTAADVLGDRHDRAGGGRLSTVTAAFPGTRVGDRRQPLARIASVSTGAATGRLALLHLAGRSPAGPALLAACGEPGNRPVLVHGYPPRLADGVWARARAAGAPAPGSGCIQLAADTVPCPRIGRGFRGAGVLDARSGAVIGIVVAEDPTAAVPHAWMLPVEAVIEAFPALVGQLAEPRPLRRGWLFDLLDTMLAVPAVADERSRDQIVRLLRPDIATTISRRPNAHFDTWAVLQTCLNFPDGLTELVDAIRAVEGETLPLLRLAQQAAAVPADLVR